MFPVTDAERIFFIIMINAGDVLFALAFGMIAQITMQQSTNDLTVAFIDKTCETEKFLDEFKVA